MSRLLSELLQAEEPFFGMAIERLEQSSGHAGVDVRLSAEIIGKVHIKLRSLGLDPRDTTGAELYRALFNLVKKHDEFLAARIGIQDASDVAEVLGRVQEAASALDVPKKAWVLKQSVAKRLIKATPPKKVMKQLGYRSVDSLVKRERIGVIFGGMRFIESDEWMRAFVSKYKQLKPTDFELRNIEIITLSDPRWGSSAQSFVNRKRHNIAHIKETGTILLLPLPVKKLPGVTIVALPLVLYYINEIRLYGTFFKSQQVKAGFGSIVVDTINNDTGKHARVADQHVHWRVVHRHFGSGKREHPEIFEPHVEPEDLLWRQAEETLYRLEPALHFWYDVEYVSVMFDGKPVSFNLMDMAVSYINGLAYGDHSIHHMQGSLWNELYARYIGEQVIERQVLNQLGDTSLDPEIFAIGLKGEL